MKARKVLDALNSRELFCNPDLLDHIANEIDCDHDCDYMHTENDTGFCVCRKSERGEYCPNDLAETLRELAKVSRDLSKETT